MAHSGTLILGQYKVIRVLKMQDNYAAVQAVDILDRQQSIRLLNIYEGMAARRYAQMFMAVRHCPEFLGTRLDGESLIAVFAWRDAPLIDSVFFADSGQHWFDRLNYAELLFRFVLSLWDQPAELGCAALRSSNLCVLEQDQKLWVNYCVEPTEKKLAQRELICLASDQAKKILLQTWNTELPQRRFLLELTGGRWKDAIHLNSAWNIARPQIEGAYTKRENQLLIRRTFGRLIMNIRWRREERKSIYGKR